MEGIVAEYINKVACKKRGRALSLCKIRFAQVKFLFLLAIAAITVPLLGYTDQTTTERVVKENKEFIEFLDICLSNFGSENDDQKNRFFNVYQDQFNAEVSFLQSDYKRSFKSIYSSQGKNVDLYNDVLNIYYLDESKKILDKLAPSIIKSKNSSARLYLTLGYRDRALARNIQKIGNASRPHLRSYKIYSYQEAIKLARRSKRYALLALFESQDREVKKEIYNHVFEGERQANNPFFNRFLSKDDQQYVAEMNREYENYEQEYQPKLESERKEYEDSGRIPDRTGTAATSDTANMINPVDGSRGEAVTGTKEKAMTEYLYEQKTQRRLRFKDEQRTAEYVRLGDFDLGNQIIVRYIDDFNFKMISATIEVLKARQENQTGIDYSTLMLQHLDANDRYSKPSLVESFMQRVRVIDDVEGSDADAAAAAAQENEANQPPQ